MIRTAFAALLLGVSLTASARATTQRDLDSFARGLGVRLTILDNAPPKCPGGREGCFLSEIDLRVPQDLSADLSRGKFALYFNSVAPVFALESDTFSVRHINGDLHVIEPRAGAPVVPGSRHRMNLWSQGHFFSAFYPMPNMFLASEGLQARTVEATRPVIDRESGLERLPFVAPMTDEAKLATAGAGDDTKWQTAERAFATYASRPVASDEPDVVIIPTPASVSRPAGQALDLRSGVSLRVDGFPRALLDPAIAGLHPAGVTSLARGPQLLIRRVAVGKLRNEGYKLTAGAGADRRIVIEAVDAAGASNALRSLAQQLRYEGGRLRPLKIEDAPRLPFRGLHIDLARNFHSKQEVLKLMEQMSIYKLNRLHLHLGDDEGWRLQIRGLPELTSVGAFRCFDPTETRCLLPALGSGPDRNTSVNGFLSQADYSEILRAAKARNIDVIPSFDMPGHSRAAIRSMEARYRRLMAAGQKAEAERFRLVEPADQTQYQSVQFYSDNTLNVCMDSTYRFVDAVIDELAALHNAAGTPLKTYHIGADETAGAWVKSPACRARVASTGRSGPQLGAMFIEQVSQSLAKRKIAVAGWSDGLGHVDAAKMPARVQSNIWGDLFTAAPAEAHRHANHGWNAVISVPNVLYLDVPYAPDPLERGLDWPTRGTDTFKVFSFLPENLAANASVMRNIYNKPVTVTDAQSLAAGRRIGGVQAQIWSETVRSDQLLDYMLFPRLIAMAERGWHTGSWEPAYAAGATYSFGDNKVDSAKLGTDWAQFSAKLRHQLPQLEQAGVQYRLAPPGARIVNGVLEANTEFAGQTIEYRTGRGQWQRYTAPVQVSAQVEVRSRSFDGSRTSRVVPVSR